LLRGLCRESIERAGCLKLLTPWARCASNKTLALHLLLYLEVVALLAVCWKG
jgi:hypothetical protein